MVMPLPFSVNLYHEGVFQVNPLSMLILIVRSLMMLASMHNGYDIMEMIDEELHPKKPVSHVDSDLDVKTNHPLDDVAHVVEKFEHKDEGNVNIPRMTTDDQWLNKLVGNDTFIGQTENPNLTYKHGYQLWYMHQGHNNILVFCSRDVSEGKCAGLKGKKPKTDDNEECETSKQGSKKGNGRKAVNEIISKVVKERWDKKKEYEKKRVSKQEHYSKLWQYRQAILDINPGSTCELKTEVNDEDGKLYFRRDANNQMFLIAWAVVGVENNQNWCWFLSFLRDDLNLGDGGGISMISDGHKGLMQAVADWLPNAEHIQCCCCNINAYSLSTKMEEFNMLDEKEHKWLVEKNPNSWCRAYFEMDKCSAAFENGILENFNSMILGARGKPIITMLEGIRVYLMQRMWCMNKLAFDNKDSITPSVRRHMEYNKRFKDLPKLVLLAAKVVLGVVLAGGSRGDSWGGTRKRGRGSSKRGGCFIPLQGLRDESDEEHKFKIDMEAVYQMEAEQIANEYEQARIRKLLEDSDEDVQFWEDCAREFDHVKEPTDDKGLPEDVSAGKQPMIEDDLLQVGADLPTRKAQLKPTQNLPDLRNPSKLNIQIR
ncbi:multidrug resistance-associated protein 5 [Tanacetum coccineum]